MALTKAQVSLLTITALGVAPGGYENGLKAFATQKDLANYFNTLNLLGAGKTNAEFALEIAKNVGLSAGADAVTKLFSALESGTSRADAMLDFANGQLVAGNATLTAALAKAEAYTAGATDMAVLKGVVAPDAVVTPSGLVIEFKDTETDQTQSTGTNPTPSDTDVLIYNIGKAQLDAGANKISADFTFKLANQIGTEKYSGLFLSPIIDAKPPVNTASALYVELLDLRAAADGKQPLERLPVNGFGFTLDGKQIIVQSDAIHAAKTYVELETAIKARIAELANGTNVPNNSDGSAPDLATYAKLANFTVAQGSSFSVKNQSGADVSGTQIVLTDTAGAALTPQGFSNKDGVIADPGYTLYAQLNNVSSTPVSQLVSTNLEATNVGYGSQGAAVNIAGQSNSDKGVEELKITAKNGVWFTSVSSKATTHHLERIELQTGSNGYFRVGTQKNDANHIVALVDETFNTAGLTDVQELEAGAVESVAINSYISENVIKAEYDLQDTGLYTADDANANITYNLTSGRDVLNLAIDTDVLEAVDTQVVVNTGAGNDIVTVMATDGLTANKAVALQVTSAGKGWVTNQQLLDNVTIDAGSGDDWVLTPGAGAAIINAGAGNDVVRVDNAGDRGVFVFNNATTDIQKLVTNQDVVSNSDDSLTNNANGTAQTYNFFKAQVKVSFKGFESSFVTIDSTNYQTTTKQINQAIKKAVNEDAVLSKLMFAHDNEGNALGLESLIDGALATNELVIDIIPPVAYNATESAAAKAVREADSGNLMLASDDLTKADAAYKQASGTLNTAAIDAAVNNAEALYASEFGTNGTNTTTTVATTTAGAFEVQNFDLSTVSVAAGESLTFTVDGAAFVYSNATAGALTGAPLAAAIAAGIAPAAANGATYTFTQSGATSTLVITQSVLSKNIADIAAVNSGAGGTIGAPATGSVNGANEVQTLDLSNVTVANGQTLIFTSAGLNTGSVTYTNNTGADISGTALATAVQGAINANANAGATVAGTTVTVTYDGQIAASAGDTAEIVVTGTGAGTNTLVNINGTVSGAESDNVVNLGSGQDVLTLGTGALSNDTVVITGYDNGVNTIVNFTTGAVAKTNGADLLDFSAYLTSVNATTKALIANTVNGTALAADNSVSIVDFNTGTALEIADVAVTFESLTAANVLAMINGTEAAGTSEFGNLNIDAVSGTTGETDNFVLLVHDNAQGADQNNEGVYKAFHVTSAGGSTDVATVQLIGTFDFGETAAGNSYLDGLVTANLA